MKNDPFLFGAWEVDDVSLTNGRVNYSLEVAQKANNGIPKNCGVFGIQELPLFQRFLVSKLLFFFRENRAGLQINSQTINSQTAVMM